MNRLLQNDIEAEAITLEAEASRLEQSLAEADMSERERENAIRLYAGARREAASKLRAALYAVQKITPVGFVPA